MIFPQLLWKVEKILFKTVGFKTAGKALCKTIDFSTMACSQIFLGIPGFSPVFHIKFYYYCYY